MSTAPELQTRPDVAYFDCPAGASGDMILGACLDAGLPLDILRDGLALLDIPGHELETTVVPKQGLAARRFVVRAAREDHHRTWAQIRDLIDRSELGLRVKGLALAIFSRLAQVEAQVHGRPVDEVHFHEVGALDSIIDIVGISLAWEYFGWPPAWASALPLGQGFVATAHGRLPLPAPATLALLSGVPTYGTGLEAELVTPTGAAILTTLAQGFGSRPAMTIMTSGSGAGHRDLPDRPNILRLTLGWAAAGVSAEHLTQAETNIDDLNPEIYPYLLERLLAAGALDVWLTPLVMKKGRPGTMLSLLAPPGHVDTLIRLVLNESTTLGVRTWPVNRTTLPREVITVTTAHGPAQVKMIQRGSRTEFTPEYESCRRLAQETGLSLREVYSAVQEATRSTK